MVRVCFSPFFLACLVTALGAAIAYDTLNAGIGIDDANITHVYARNIAAGHGYVYNVGGERVEGSTSLLWTLLNVAGFAITQTPEALITSVTAGLTVIAVCCGLGLVRDLTDGSRPALLLTALSFLAFPPFFGWMVWSLMDTALWVSSICLVVALLHRLDRCDAPGRSEWLILTALAIAIPLIRPEGFVVTTAIGVYLLVPGQMLGARRRPVALVLLIVGLAALAAVTLWRLWYFGYPFPNTVYAKTSSDLVQQVLSGAKYILSYLQAPGTALFFGMISIAACLVMTRGQQRQQNYMWLVLYLILGGAAFYGLMGGDHFGSHRFFLYFLPLGLPLIAVGLVEVLRSSGTGHPAPAVVLTALVVLASAANIQQFRKDKGGLYHEFRIASEGRAYGETLSALPGEPTVGVIAAGGLRLGYSGSVVQDLMGLNWTKVAHAPDDAVISQVPNHGGFNTDIFWQDPPDVLPVFPSPKICPEGWQPLQGFKARVTDHITATAAFQAHYDLYCLGTDSFYARKDYVAAAWGDAEDLPYKRVAP